MESRNEISRPDHRNSSSQREEKEELRKNIIQAHNSQENRIISNTSEKHQ